LRLARGPADRTADDASNNGYMSAHDRYSFPTIEFRARYTVRLISRLQFDYCTHTHTYIIIHMYSYIGIVLGVLSLFDYIDRNRRTYQLQGTRRNFYCDYVTTYFKTNLQL